MRPTMNAARLLMLTGAIIAIAACSETTAPTTRVAPSAGANDGGGCLTGYQMSDGRCVPDTTGH